jgi:hypothetical protein
MAPAAIAPTPVRYRVDSVNRRREAPCRYPWRRLSLSDFGIYLSVGEAARRPTKRNKAAANQSPLLRLSRVHSKRTSTRQQLDCTKTL